MPDKQLPIYEIQDFGAARKPDKYIYLSDLRSHLQNHLFIQKPHKHNAYILVFFTKGSGTHTIDFQEYLVAPGSVFFLTPGQVHSWKLSEQTNGYILFFSAEFYLLGFPLQKLQRFPFFEHALRVPYLQVKATDMTTILLSINVMQQEHQAQQFLKDDLLRDYLDIILIQLARLYHSTHKLPHESTASLPLLTKLNSLIDQHYKEHQPVLFYADKLHVTAKQLNETCKRAYDKTTTELIQNRVILEAKRLLVHSNLTINQLAAGLGYFDNAYFFRFFKKHTGQTPEQFRQTHS
ncbi:helix-turn-helix domain-containing protein [Pontibacter fetidus]|uniref:Helix-turn-helix domain-containing protein n=1 Tax=Pontibacter fetidus TaxID=2700082 RepID=A0A6B2H2Q4_9BACT|nr:helix-turn-helix domain-containing protein [Pontibacter fetidus]NDK56378.1 helix-turn-helix domain-containing protein [Pontibacter fetidus]